jgi:2-polyprenyl-6-methoxyphenol hydroxylase-like FAD-dependent oxidoreductase
VEGLKPRVVVLGCGPAGAAAAITMARAGLDVVTIDPSEPGWEPGEGLPAAATGALRTLGVWPRFQQGGHLMGSGFLSCWGSAEPVFRPALLDPRGPSWQLDRADFNKMLRTAAGEPLPLRVSSARRAGRSWMLRFPDRPEIRADFLVDATGRSGVLARLLEVHRRVDSRLVGIVALVANPDPQDAVSVVEATPHGWWYASRVPGDRLVVALFTDAAIAGRDRLTSPGPWSELLGTTTHAARRAGSPDHRICGSVRTQAAGSSALDSCGGVGWLAVGDAACAHDPLSSRGLHDALTGGIAAGEAIVRAAAGDAEAIDRYAREVAAGYATYLSELDWYYQQEKRFPGTAFWAARQGQA